MGGLAVEGVAEGINREYIEPTISYLDNIIFKPLNIDHNCWTSELGSVGKKEISGDIDIAINYNEIKEKLNLITDQEVDKLLKDQLTKEGIEYTTKKGINLKFPIQGSSTNDYIQIDLFKTSNLEFTKFAKFSPNTNESKYRGDIRSEFMRQLIKMVSLEPEEEGKNEIFTADGIEYPAVNFTQASVCDDGVYKTHKSFIGKKGKIVGHEQANKAKQTLITQDPQDMLNIYFGKDTFTKEDFNSFESIWNNVLFNEKFPYKEKRDQICLRLYNVIKNNKRYIMPKELETYIHNHHLG